MANALMRSPAGCVGANLLRTLGVNTRNSTRTESNEQTQTRSNGQADVTIYTPGGTTTHMDPNALAEVMANSLAQSLAPILTPIKESITSNNNPSTGTTQHLPTPPKFGVVIQDGNTMYFWMGGKPKADWSGLECLTTPSHPSQTWSVDRTYSRKSAAKAVSEAKFSPVYNGDAMEWANYLSFLKTFTEQNGMEQLGFIPHPTKPGEVFDILENPHLVARDKALIEKADKLIRSQANAWEEDNHAVFWDVLMKTISKDMRGKVTGINTRKDSYLILYCKIMQESSALTMVSINEISAQARAIHIDQFEGQNVRDACEKFRTVVLPLMHTNLYEPAMLLPLIDSFQHCIPMDDPNWTRWWPEMSVRYQNPMIKCCEDMLTKEFVPATHQNDQLKEDGLDCESQLKAWTHEYEYLVINCYWPAALNPVDTKAP